MSTGVTSMVPLVYMKGCSHKVPSSCPAGHEMLACKDSQDKNGYFCKQCGENSFQPNSNRAGDKCRLRKICAKPMMTYKKAGSTTEDAQCICKDGFHFENKDQRACVPNRVCDKGFGQGDYGVCIECIKHGMYSASKDRKAKCKALTNCHKQGRCITKKSNGTYDNTCGRQVDDLSKCSDLPPEVSESTQDQVSTGVIVACVLGLAAVVIIIIILVLCYRRRRSKKAKGRLSKDQLDEILNDIIQKTEKNEILCRKVLSCYFGEIENKIDRQVWNLAQELFKEHYQPAKYELIVKKYEKEQRKFAINGYLQEWREWKGDSAQTIIELTKCLKQCGREDVTYGICSSFQDPVVNENSVDTDKNSKPSFCHHFMPRIFCIKKDQESPDEVKETTSKLLDPEIGRKEAGLIYRDRPCPSAPVFEDKENSIVILEGQFKRTMSYPVQACS